MDIPEPVLALIAAIFGGAGLKLIENMATRKQLKDKTALDMRSELREEVKYLREQLKEAEEENERIRNNYYELREEFLSVKTDLEAALKLLTTQAEQAKKIIEEVPKTDGAI